MEELTLNFLGEETKIEIPTDLPSLKSKISEKYLLSIADTNELILYYVKDDKKIYIINGNDYFEFKITKISTIFIDINQNSKLYIENASKLNKEKSEEKKDEKELNELLKKYEIFSKEKNEKVSYYYKELNEVMKEVKRKRDELNRKIHKALAKYYEKDEEYIKKIYCLQRKLNVPTTVRIPKDIKQQEEERIKQECIKKNEEIRRIAKLKKEEKEEKKRKYFEHVKKLMEEDEKKKQMEKLKLKSTQCMINKNEKFIPHQSLRKIEEEKYKMAFKCRAVAAATAAKFISAKKMENEKLKTSYEILQKKNNTINNNEINTVNTVPILNKVNEVLNNTITEVKEIAKDHILKNVESNKKDKKEIEKEKKDQIEKIKNITRETVKEINRLTKMIIEQSNALIERINNPEMANLSNDENIILKAPKKEKPIKEGIHFHISCDGCKMNPIRGNRYKCKGCPNFDFCQKCYEKNKETHGHEFTKIEKPKNTQRMGHKNKAYAGRGIVHKGVRCEGCGLEPIVGWRFKCSICDDYNLCENCEENIGCKKHNHPFIKLYYSMMENVFNDYHLKLNSYESTNDTK